jgi:hypothetical protein
MLLDGAAVGLKQCGQRWPSEVVEVTRGIEPIEGQRNTHGAAMRAAE